ncbi:MAG: T9SS type A sorting domain-containing protein, partial [Fibromonadales bacterium]|nr:T9SS type A sorting domain-containing protein [Fibromonadales bacterium]
SSSSGGSSSSVSGSSSSEEGENTAILSQIAVSNQVMKVKNGINLHAVNGAIVEIFNTNGSLINKQNYSSGIYSVSFSNMPKGMYIVKVRFDKGAKILRVPVM